MICRIYLYCKELMMGGGKDKAASCVQIRRSYKLFKNRIITHENDYNREFCRAQLNRFLLRRRGETS